MKIELIKKDIYGKELYRPHNDKAVGVLGLMKQSTFTPAQVKQLREVGFEVVVFNDY